MMNARVFVSVVAALLLSGCFDGHYDIGLKNDGSGTVAVDLVLDTDLSRDVLKEGKGKFQQADQSQLGKNAHSSQRVENGSLIISQRLNFKSLSEITGGNVDIEVSSLGRSTFGVARSRIRFATSRNPGEKGQKQADDVGDQLIDQMFKGHEMRVTMHLPCQVESAEPLRRDGAVYAPTVNKNWFGGATVEWRVPMPVMIKMDSHGGPHDFVATCWSFAGIKPGRSRVK
jgi:hypothetical protein